MPLEAWMSVSILCVVLCIIILSGMRLIVSPLGTAATTGLLYQPQMICDGDCGAVSGMRIGRGNRSTQRKPAPAPLCPSQIQHDQTQARSRAAAVGSQPKLWRGPLSHVGSGLATGLIPRTRSLNNCL
jgi:hypothetical protein